MVPWITKGQMKRYLSGSIFSTIWLKDNEKIYLGNDKDGEVYYDGTNMSFKDDVTSVKTLEELAAGGGASTNGTICLHPNAAIVNATDGATRVQTDGTNHAFNTLDFDTTTVEKADWHFTVPRDYDDGNVVVSIIWIASATSGGVVFDASYVNVLDSAQYDQSLTNVACPAVTVDGTQWDTNLSTCTLTTPYTSGQVGVLRIHRETADGSDTMAGDARVIMVKLRYTRDEA